MEEGFSCEFVDPPPILFQTECPVCLLILREPYQVSCCGQSYCFSCIRQVGDGKKPCPTCKTERFSYFPNKSLKQSLSTFKVFYSHKKNGCEWIGELGELEEHLNKDPQSEKQLVGCQFAKVDCVYGCGEQLQRECIQTHQAELCPQRPLGCEHCHSYESTYDDIKHNHWPVCQSFPVHCPNQCGFVTQRHFVSTHLANVCPIQETACSFSHLGCKEKLSHKDIPEHMKENLLSHMSLLATSYTKMKVEHETEINRLQTVITDQQAQVASLATEKASLRIAKLELRCDQLKDENTRLKKELSVLSHELKTRGKSNTILGLPTVSISNFKQRLEDKDTWYSPPVYTHQMGYKLCLRVDANGHRSGKGSFVSIGLCLMKGEYDHFLKWPFRGTVSVQLLDRLTGKDHISCVLAFDERVGGRVTEGKMSKSCITASNFIAHSKLEPKYLVDHSLSFQLYKVELNV